MAYLDIDTDVLRQSAAMAKHTNEAITEACTLLNQVVVHNDWHCQERTKINENTVTNRQEAQKLQGYAEAFYQAVAQASAQFDEKEQSMISRVNQVEELLSQILSVVQGISGGVGSAPSLVSFDSIRKSLED